MGSVDPAGITPEWFWTSFRRRLCAEGVCTEENLSSSRRWTKQVIAAAVEVCRELGDEVVVRQETPHRLDVSASRPGGEKLLVAFESELAPVGYMNRKHAKTWREEFVKLWGIPAELRVLSAYFMPGTGKTFPHFLRQQLDDLRAHVAGPPSGKWLLVFGSENSEKDWEQHWLAFSFGADGAIREICHDLRFRPRCIARGIDKVV